MLFNNINDGNIVATFIEASTFKGYKCTKNEDVPKEFKSIAIKVAETAESVIGRKIGEGVDSIIFGKLSYQIANKIEKIKNEKHPRNTYIFIIPQKIMLGIPTFVTPKQYAKIAEEILTKSGFKKGQNIDELPNSRYFYKYSNDKKHIYISNCVAASAGANLLGIGTVNSFQLSVQCADNTEEIRNIVESGIFESVELI